MEISFSTKKLEKILTDVRKIKQYYGAFYKSLLTTLSILEVTKNLSLVSHLPPTRRHLLVGQYKGHWGIDVSKNFRLIIRAHESQTEYKEEDVTHIVIVEIVDYH